MCIYSSVNHINDFGTKYFFYFVKVEKPCDPLICTSLFGLSESF